MMFNMKEVLNNFRTQMIAMTMVELLPKGIEIIGAVYDVKSGKLTKI